MNTSPQLIPQFIKKILQMMQKHQTIISWNQQGTQLVVADQISFIETVLPQFFRHDKFQSFVRQLNMYGFHKVCRNKNSINFRNQYFQRDNEPNFHLIKRKKKQVAELKAEINQRQQDIKDIVVNKYESSYPAVSNLFVQLLEFKNKNLKEMNNLKRTLDQLNRELNQRKSKKIKPIVGTIKEMIAKVQDNSAKIDFSLEKCQQVMKNQTIKVTQVPLIPIILPQLSSFTCFNHNNTEYNTNLTQNSSLLGITSYCSFNSVTNFMA